MFSLDSFRLDGRRALVTGGATGIGAAIARGLAAAGADVAVTFHTRPPDDVIAAIGGLGRKAEAIETDLWKMDDVHAARLIAAPASAIGPIDILVNNAGIIHRNAALDYSWAEWRRALSINLDSAWLMSQAAAGGMAAAGRGGIVTIASILAFQGGVRVPAYTAAKHALVRPTRALANEWAVKGINVNAIAPGYVGTENTRALREDPVRAKELVGRIPAGRFAEPDDMAGAAVFLASDAAAYVNGAVLVVDGGWLAR
ncbi:MAG: SDR family oxidoreductase [Bauldia sp.]|nr:SDR family oxidoreductase [Bauldia sp.]